MNTFFYILIDAFVIYGLTFLIASSRIFQYPRNLFRAVVGELTEGTALATSFVQRTKRGTVVLETDTRNEEELQEIGSGYDFASCRMCVGFWVALLLMLILNIIYFASKIPVEVNPKHIFAAYAISYFLATQERFKPCCPTDQ